jgi:hypothetical protein
LSTRPLRPVRAEAAQALPLIRPGWVAGLFGACQARWIQLHPLPDLADALAHDQPVDRLRTVLLRQYRWYRETAPMAEWVERPGTRDLSLVMRRFVREAPTDDLGTDAPFLCRGQCDHVEHRGGALDSDYVRLQCPMPADTFRMASVVAS